MAELSRIEPDRRKPLATRGRNIHWDHSRRFGDVRNYLRLSGQLRKCPARSIASPVLSNTHAKEVVIIIQQFQWIMS